MKPQWAKKKCKLNHTKKEWKNLGHLKYVNYWILTPQSWCKSLNEWGGSRAMPKPIMARKCSCDLRSKTWSFGRKLKRCFSAPCSTTATLSATSLRWCLSLSTEKIRTVSSCCSSSSYLDRNPTLLLARWLPKLTARNTSKRCSRRSLITLKPRLIT